MTELKVPYDTEEDRFHLAFSDGTLIVGEYEPEDDKFYYRVEVAGAGIVEVRGRELALHWRVEWVTISIYRSLPDGPSHPVLALEYL